MNKLIELYAKRKVFEDYGAAIPDTLTAEIKEAEASIFANINNAVVEVVPPSIKVEDLSENVVVALEYVDGALSRIGSGINKPDIFSTLDLTVLAVDDYEDEETDDDNLDRTRSRSIPFSVKFPDGKIFRYNKAQWTLIDSLKHMGLERASHFTGEMFKGFPLVGKRQRIIPDGQQWQKQIDGWWIYINMSNARKIRCLEGVAKMLNIPIMIELLEARPTMPTPVENVKGKNATFSLNGSAPLKKNRSVLEAVRLFLKEIPTATFEDVESQFPKHLQGSYGVVRTLDDVKERSLRNKTENDRWFLDPSEILTSTDGVQFAVSTEWGNQFPQFQKHVADAFGWALNEVK